MLNGPETSFGGRVLATLRCSAAMLLVTAAPLAAAVGVWTPVGPEGGGPQVIAPDPQSASRLFAAFPWGPYGGLETLVMRTDDGGASWQESNDGLEGERIVALAVDPEDSERVFAVAAVQGCSSDDPGGVYRSGDGGAHWELSATSAALGGLACRSSVLVLSDAVLVGTGGGIARSEDGGLTWQQIPLLPAPNGIHTLLRDPSQEDVLYAAGWTARFKSTDGGLTWTVIHDPTTGWIFALAISRSDPETLYEYGQGQEFGQDDALWRSRDGGATWGPAMNAPDVSSLDRAPLLVDPHDPDTVFLGTERGGWVSRDGGATFHLLRRDLPDMREENTRYPGVMALALDAGERILLASLTGLWSSTDAGYHWSKAALHGVHANEVRFLRFDPFEARHFLFTSFDTLFETRNGGATFAPLAVPQPGLLQAIEFDPFQRGRVVALTVQNDFEHPVVYRIFASTDGGRHWGAPFSAPAGATDLAVPAGDALLVTAGNRIYLRRNGVWRKQIQVEPSDERGGFSFGRIVADPYRAGAFFALGYDFFLHGGAKLVWYRSLDAGRTWRPWLENAGTLAFDPVLPDVAYTAGYGDIFQLRITGGGKQKIGVLRPRDALAPLLVDRSDPRTFFAGTGSSGVLVSHDRAAHWSLLAPGLPLDGKVTVTDLQQDPLNPLRLYATPATGGLWRVDLAPH